MNQQNERRPSSPSPFGHALYLARKISSRDDDTAELSSAMKELGDEEKKKLVFRLQADVLEGKTELPGLFAAARIAHMITVGHYTAAARKAMQNGGVTLDDLRRVGLAKIITSNDGRRLFIRYTIGHKTLQAATASFREEGNFKAAEALEYPLLQAQKRQMLNKAAREAAAANEKEAVAESDTDDSVVPEKIPETSAKAAEAKESEMTDAETPAETPGVAEAGDALNPVLSEEAAEILKSPPQKKKRATRTAAK